MSKSTINNGDTGLAARNAINGNFSEVYRNKIVFLPWVTGDMTTALQAALAEITSMGGGAIVLDGNRTYQLDSSVAIVDGVIIIGDGSLLDGTLTVSSGTIKFQDIGVNSLTVSGGVVYGRDMDVIVNLTVSAGETDISGRYHGGLTILSGGTSKLHFDKKNVYATTNTLLLTNAAIADVFWGEADWAGNAHVRKSIVRIQNTSNLKFTCKSLSGRIHVEDSATCEIRDTQGYIGENYINVSDSGTCYVYNSYLRHDVPDIITGLHCLEMPWVSQYQTYGNQTLKCYNSTFEYMAYGGVYESVGNPVALYAGLFEAYGCTFIKADANDGSALYPGIGVIGYGCKHIFSNCTFLDKDTYDSGFSVGVNIPALDRCIKETSEYYSIMNNCAFISTRRDKAGINYVSLMPDDGDGSSHIVSTDTTDYDAYADYYGVSMIANTFANQDGDDFFISDITGAGALNWKNVLMPYWNDRFNFDFINKRITGIETNDVNMFSYAQQNAVAGTGEYIKRVNISNGIFGTNADGIDNTEQFTVTLNYFLDLSESQNRFCKARGTLWFTNTSGGNKNGYMYEIEIYMTGAAATLTDVSIHEVLDWSVSPPVIAEVSKSGTQYVFKITHANATQLMKAYIDWHDVLNIDTITIVKV